MSEEEEVMTGVSTLVFFVNGKKVVDNDVDPEWTLLYYLRNKLKLYGTKLGCAEGGCGACTVLLSRYNRKKKKIVHLAVNACLAAICSVHGCAVTTVEGIGSTRTKLHPVQERLAKAHGSQCGFCTPGIIMSMYALLRANPKPKMVDMEIAFQGNLCRCTGYRPIIEGLRTFTEEWEQAQIHSKMNEQGGDGYGNGLVNGNGITNGHSESSEGEDESVVNGNGVTSSHSESSEWEDDSVENGNGVTSSPSESSEGEEESVENVENGNGVTSSHSESSEGEGESVENVENGNGVTSSHSESSEGEGESVENVENGNGVTSSHSESSEGEGESVENGNGVTSSHSESSEGEGESMVNGKKDVPKVNGLEGKAKVNGLENGTKTNGLEGKAKVNGLEGKEKVNGLEGTEKVNGLEGKAKVNGVEGKAKVNGVEGKAKVNGLEGKAKVNGVEGKAKVNGLEGTEKVNGLEGKAKVNGVEGKAKVNGLEGKAKVNGLEGKAKVNGLENGTKVNGLEGKAKVNGVEGKANVNGLEGKTKVNGLESTEKVNGLEGKEKVNGLENGTKVNGCEEGVKLANGHAETSPCGMGKFCCKNTSNYYRDPEEILFNLNEFSPYDPSQEVIFPPELLLSSHLDEQKLVVKGPRSTWYRPTTFEEVLRLKKKFPQMKVINGNTEVGVEVKFKNFVYPVFVNPIQVDELTGIEFLEDGIKFGAAVTLNEINDVLKHQIATQPEWKTRIFKGATGILHWFAGKQIRNVSAIGGNIMTGSPISDMVPVLMAANVNLYLNSLESSRVIKLDHKFFTGYRRNVVQPDEVLTAILFPYTHEDQYFNAYKQAKRRDDDIAIVNCAANVEFEPGTDKIKDIHVAFGGVAPCTSLAVKTGEKIIGRSWNDDMIEDAFTSLIEEFPLAPNAPGGMIRYRRSLVLSLFFKFYLYVRDRLSKKNVDVPAVPQRLRSGIEGFHSGELKSSQYFQVVPKHQDVSDAVGRPIVHVNAYKQVAGEAIYLDDIPRVQNELYGTLVLSTRPHAKVLKMDLSQAMALPGVYAFIGHEDLGNVKNEMGPIFHDEKIFYHDEVTSQGQVMGLIVAENQIISQRAAKMVKVEYEDLSPVIISIEQAIEHQSFIGGVKRIRRGNPEEAFETCDFVREWEVKMGGQEHFYLETQCALAVPKEDELELFCSSQNAAEIQKLVAMALGITCSRVMVRVKRIGGGFGGKESRASIVAVPLSLAAYKLKRPIRCMLDRDEDMLSSGTRHPFMAKYKVGFNKDGKIIAATMDIYCNGGYSMDLSCGVLDRALFHADNAYNIPNMDVKGYICLTNLPSNTAFRGFGGPQGMFFCEDMFENVAWVLNMSAEEVRYMNLYQEGDTTHYNQLLTHCTQKRCWEECYRNSEYQERKREVEEFNRKHRYRKRGISLIPVKFGIAFTELSLNQAGALVNIYRDGSVLITHGGIEMGQGLNTKMIQVASRALGVDASMIYISEMASDKVPNTSATAASSGSDLNGMAVMNACHKLVKRLEPFKKANPTGTWKEWVAKAVHSRVGLSATGFYMTPEIGYSFETNSGMAFNYFTYGAAASVVEIDCLSGDHQVLRTDIVMDLGESLNPAIDIGQVEGAFVQGQGLFTIEELLYSPTGTIFTRGPGMYKIPGFADIPLEFNVSLLRGAPNPRAVYSSKAVGEPPLFLASSIFFAIKNAIKAAREEEGVEGYFRFDSPATGARIRMHCVDRITDKFPEPDPNSYKPWNIVP